MYLKKQSQKEQNPKKWVNQDGEFYNKLLKRFLRINTFEIYSTCNKVKHVAAERFIRTLKNKIFRHMAAVSKNIYFDGLDDIVIKYNNIVHRTKKMKPIGVTSDSYAEYIENSNEKELKKTSQEKFRTKKVIKRKGNKFEVKWKGYDNSFNRILESILSQTTTGFQHLVCKPTLNHLEYLAKCLSSVVSTCLYGKFDCMFLSCHVKVSA